MWRLQKKKEGRPSQPAVQAHTPRRRCTVPKSSTEAVAQLKGKNFTSLNQETEVSLVTVGHTECPQKGTKKTHQKKKDREPKQAADTPSAWSLAGLNARVSNVNARVRAAVTGTFRRALGRSANRPTQEKENTQRDESTKETGEEEEQDIFLIRFDDIEKCTKERYDEEDKKRRQASILPETPAFRPALFVRPRGEHGQFAEDPLNISGSTMAEEPSPVRPLETPEEAAVPLPSGPERFRNGVLVGHVDEDPRVWEPVICKVLGDWLVIGEDRQQLQLSESTRIWMPESFRGKPNCLFVYNPHPKQHVYAFPGPCERDFRNAPPPKVALHVKSDRWLVELVDIIRGKQKLLIPLHDHPEQQEKEERKEDEQQKKETEGPRDSTTLQGDLDCPLVPDDPSPTALPPSSFTFSGRASRSLPPSVPIAAPCADDAVEDLEVQGLADCGGGGESGGDGEEEEDGDVAWEDLFNVPLDLLSNVVTEEDAQERAVGVSSMDDALFREIEESVLEELRALGGGTGGTWDEEFEEVGVTGGTDFE